MNFTKSCLAFTSAVFFKYSMWPLFLEVRVLGHGAAQHLSDVRLRVLTPWLHVAPDVVLVVGLPLQLVTEVRVDGPGKGPVPGGGCSMKPSSS
jgi:hypothetical protein